MKKIIVAFLAVTLLICVEDSYGQKGLELTLKYNSQAEKYEVYAKPNFSQRNFLLGPSQITMVVPSAVSDEKLRIQNSDGGTWEDNSIVFSPTVNPASDYHGITTLGAKTDFIEGVETMLFSFLLSANINPTEVKLFENEKDPKSSAPGMKGGDFSNTINSALAEEYYIGNYKDTKVVLGVSEENKTKLMEFENENLLLYPNTTNEDFKIVLNGVEDFEEVTMIVATEMGREIMKVKGKKADLMEKTFKIPVKISSQSLVVRVKTQKTTFGKKLILDRE
ncbi:hypothetical protein [Emticicia sp. W12TSBA100-4]|uniref:hypothetical protein n=1 Tax=Emticicia sp. W12TSBA100-4 TaxID=3160965 RepID=UPI003305AB6E